MHILWRIIFLISALHYGVKCKKQDKGLARIEKYPFLVSVQEKNSHKCNGVILTRKFILTSGHCLDKHLNSYSILAAADDLSAGFQAKRAKVLHFKGHLEAQYDIGLMELKDPLNYTEEIQPIKLPQKLEEIPEWGQLVGFGSYRLSKYKDRLRAIKVSVDDTVESCDEDNDMEFCVGKFKGKEVEALPEDPNKERGKEPEWVQKDKDDPFEWTGEKKIGASRRSIDLMEKDIQKLDDKGEGIMNEFALGAPFVKDGILYGFLSKKDKEIGILSSVPFFLKYIKSNVFDFEEIEAATVGEVPEDV